MRRTAREERIEEYWDWFAVALFLLIPVDLLTTLGAVTQYGVGAESNPLMRWLLTEGVGMLLLVNLAAIVTVAYGFSALVRRTALSPAPYDRYLERAIEAWLGLLVAVGLFLFANNLSVIVWGGSIL